MCREPMGHCSRIPSWGLVSLTAKFIVGEKRCGLKIWILVVTWFCFSCCVVCVVCCVCCVYVSLTSLSMLTFLRPAIGSWPISIRLALSCAMTKCQAQFTSSSCTWGPRCNWRMGFVWSLDFAEDGTAFVSNGQDGGLAVVCRPFSRTSASWILFLVEWWLSPPPVACRLRSIVNVSRP